MKLYNLFEDIILEEINKQRQIISEGVSVADINNAINGDANGKHYHVDLTYRKDNGEITNRWVQVYDYVTTKAGNDAISAFVVTKNQNQNDIGNGVWRIFRLDRIEAFKISKVPFFKAISDRDPSVPKYNKTGNNTPTLAKVNNKAKFNYQYADSTIKQKERQIKNNLDKRKETEPIAQSPKQVQQPQQQNNKEREFKY